MKILVVDDEANIRRSLKITLEKKGYFVELSETLEGAQKLLSNDYFDLMILDICLTDGNGIEFYQKMKKENVSIPVIFISGNASLQDAAKAVKNGAYDFLEKPFSSEKVLLTVEKCFQYYNLLEEIEGLKKEGPSLVGKSPAMEKLKRTIRTAADSPATILIEGESGTGKELIAKMIYNNSSRKDKPFIKVNCSAIPENLIESSLFGHKKGAFTGAIDNKKGFFEEANGGTLFLDEVADLSLSAQTKLLRALQEKEIQKVGSDVAMNVDVRVIAATNKDFKKLIEEGEFREDLYYRLNVIPISSISLRDNRDDIPLLVEYFLDTISTDFGKTKPSVTENAMKAFESYNWPGNIRELRNLIERLVIMVPNEISYDEIPNEITQHKTKSTQNTLECFFDNKYTLKQFRDEAEKNYIIQVLKDRKGNISLAAKDLDIERTHLHKKIKNLNIEKSEYSD